ncbi:MAG: VCBS repeat-containing protein, partial [Pedosphaera parvula]|nr:VCBS repeat-containing protein [Pedosphaera parvula]
MHMNRLNWPTWLGVLAGACCAVTPLFASEPAAKSFGFTGPEIFPIDEQIGQLRAGDIDGDGLQDLVVVNNLRSKINILFNQTGRTNQPAKPAIKVKREINELPPDARFRIESVASERRIASMVVADLNGDGRPDIAYYGEPKELVVLYNDGKGGWSAPKRWPIDDGQINPNALTYGDLNNDQRDDLALLSEGHLYVFYQTADHKLREPEKIPFSGTVKAVQILDINGDKREDVLLVNWDSPNPFRFRLQGASGQLGPEIHFSLPPIRSYWADDLDGDRRAEIITIAQQSGRAQISMFKQRPAEPLLGTLQQGQFQVLPLKRNPDKSRRGMIWADVNGDQLSDLLVAEPNSGQLSVYLQQAKGGLAAAQSFPTLTGVSEIAVANWDGEGTPNIFLLSDAERQVGVTHRDADGRVPFPTTVPLDGKPLAMAVAPLQKGGRPALAVIVDQDGRRSLQIRSADA